MGLENVIGDSHTIINLLRLILSTILLNHGGGTRLRR